MHIPNRFYNIDLNQEQVDLIEYALRHLHTLEPELFEDNDRMAPGAYLPGMFGDLKGLPDEETGTKMTHGFCL